MHKEAGIKVLITGGAGFIGSKLVEILLETSASITIFDKVRSTLYPELSVIGDVRDEAALVEACRGIDVIYNLAAEHADDVTPKSLYTEVNIGGAVNVISAAKANDIKKIIFTSSVAVYGLNRGEPNEGMEAKPFNEYGRTKHEAEKVFLEWARVDSTNSLVIVRPVVIFGENNRGNVYNLVNQIHRGKFLMVGNGKNHKSMGYVGNIAAFLLWLKETESGIQIFNFSDAPDLSTNEIVDIIKDELNIISSPPYIPYYFGLIGGYIFDVIAQVSGKKLPISSIRIKKFCAETTVNKDKLISSGFKPPYQLEGGLRNMIRHEFNLKKMG